MLPPPKSTPAAGQLPVAGRFRRHRSRQSTAVLRSGSGNTATVVREERYCRLVAAAAAGKVTGIAPDSAAAAADDGDAAGAGADNSRRASDQICHLDQSYCLRCMMSR